MSENNTNIPPTNRVVYILTGILIGFILGIYGVHNLIAGYKRNGLIQLGISLFCWFNLVIGMFLIIPLCIAIPLWFGLLGWTIYEVSTITVDAQGRPFTWCQGHIKPNLQGGGVTQRMRRWVSSNHLCDVSI